MSYDPVAESRRLLVDGLGSDPLSLSRRVRFAAMAYDADRDVAATLFARRSVSGRVALETWALERDRGEWLLLGGGGGGHEGNPLADRRAAADLSGRLVTISQGGRCARRTRRPGGRQRGFVPYVVLTLAREVEHVVVAKRRLAVPRHGYLIVTWAGRSEPALTLLGPADRALYTALPSEIGPAGASWFEDTSPEVQDQPLDVNDCGHGRPYRPANGAYRG